MKLYIIFSIIFLVSIAAYGQNGFPENPAGKRAESVIKMLNSTSDTELQNFINTEMMPYDEISPEARLQSFQNIRKRLSGAKLIKVLGQTDEVIYFAVRTDSGKLVKLGLKFAPNKEKRIREINMDLMSENDLNKPFEVVKKLSESEIIPTVERYLGEIVNEDKFSGVVLIAKNGKPVFEKAYGFANKEHKAPNRVDTKFNIGSINKAFTSLAIGILADEGKLSLQDKIGKHLPDYPNKEAREKVTIYHLLTMTSGIGDIFGPEFQKTPKANLRTIDDYLPLFAAKPLEFEPGSNQRYSNGGYLVLGKIIEQVSGKSYYDFVRERIYKPLEMDDSESIEKDAVIENVAQGYTYFFQGEKSDRRRNNIYNLPARGSSGGGGYSTAYDLLKFANAFETGKMKVPESLKNAGGIMIADMLENGLGIAGGSMGLNAALFSKLGDQGNYTVVVLSNYDPPSAEQVGSRISRWIGRN